MRPSRIALLVTTIPLVGFVAVPAAPSLAPAPATAPAKKARSVNITGKIAIYQSGTVRFKVGTGTCSTTNHPFKSTKPA